MNSHLLQHLLTNSAERYPEKEAIIFQDQSITYLDLEKKSNQLARALVRQGARKGDRVGLLFKKSIESIIALFGILKAGTAYVPIDPAAPTNRVKYIISNCEMECLLSTKELIAKVMPDLSKDSPLTKVLISNGPTDELAEQCKTLKITSWDEIFQVESEDHQVWNITDNYPAYILYTSGSTGLPKGVVISHINSLTFVNMAVNFFGINDNDRLCSHAPLHFDLSVFDIFVAVKSGSTIVLIPEYFSMFPIKLGEYIDQKQISVWNSVSSVLSLLAERARLEKLQFDSLRLVLFSGEILPVKYLRKVKNYMPRADFFNLYGQTEANSSTFYQINEIPDDDTWKIPIGKPFPNFQVFALNENNEVISSSGEEGELFVRGSTVAMGYWVDNERTSASFVPDPLQPFAPNRVYRTGDIVRLDSAGDYVFVGRKDHLVKSRGYRIEIDEIEISLNSCSGIRQAAAVTVPDDLIGNRIIAYVSAAAGESLKKKDITNHCAKLIPEYMIPEEIEFRSDLPKTSTGKIDRTLLAQQALSQYVHPKSRSIAI